ncbi:hypothetical protein N7513_012157 [Penicillium frequentans]|nr:hypothetical protein N7513_012157 [Penicillium glabrum]
MEVAADETFGSEELVALSHSAKAGGPGLKRSLLQVDSSGLGHLAGANDGQSPGLTGGEEDTEMRKAMQNVEQMRLRMQRASERIELEGTPAEGTLVKKKKGKKGKKGQATDQSGDTKRKKKKHTSE